MKTPAFTLLFFLIASGSLMAQEDEQTKLLEQMLLEKQAASERDGSRTGAERAATERFADEARQLDSRFHRLWVTIATTESLLEDLKVLPVDSNLQSYEKQLSELLRERATLEERMANEGLDQRDCWPDHDFTFRNYITFSQKVLRSLKQISANSASRKEENRRKAMPKMMSMVSSCRSILEKLRAAPMSSLESKDLIKAGDELSSFCSVMLDLDLMVEILDVSYSDVCPDREKMLDEEQVLESQWVMEANKRMEVAEPEVSNELGLKVVLYPWRRPSSAAIASKPRGVVRQEAAAPDAKALVREGAELMRNERYEEALLVLTRAVEADPNLVIAQKLKALAARKAKEDGEQ